jgi:hypothetical protein
VFGGSIQRPSLRSNQATSAQASHTSGIGDASGIDPTCERGVLD